MGSKLLYCLVKLTLHRFKLHSDYNNGINVSRISYVGECLFDRVCSPDRCNFLFLSPSSSKCRVVIGGGGVTF